MVPEIVETFAVRYAQDTTVDRLHRALEAGDAERAFRTAHSLRGLAQNLGFERLYQAAAVLTEALRPRRLPVSPALLAAVDAAHRPIPRLNAKPSLSFPPPGRKGLILSIKETTE